MHGRGIWLRAQPCVSGSAMMPPVGTSSFTAIERRSSKRQRPIVSTSWCGKPRNGNLTLVYGAKDEEHNQAVVLKDVIEERLTR